jgi:hypothetical protein
MAGNGSNLGRAKKKCQATEKIDNEKKSQNDKIRQRHRGETTV